MGRLDGRVAIVTGAGRGIGVFYAKALAEEGAKVCCSDILDTENTVNIIKQAGGEAIGNKCDVTQPDEVKAMVAQTVEAYGKVDIMSSLQTLLAERWQRDLGLIVNNRGDYHLKFGLAAPDKKLCENNPRVSYFVSKNKDWQQGDELACFAEMNVSVLINYLKKRLSKNVSKLRLGGDKEVGYVAR